MSSWEAIRNRSFLDAIVVTVVEVAHRNDERLDWRLTVEDRSGTRFDLDVWQTHDPLLEWEAGATYEVRSGYGQTWDGGEKKKLHSSKRWSADRVDADHDCRLLVMGDTHIGRTSHPSKPHRPIDCAGAFRQAVEVAVAQDADAVVHTGDVFHDDADESACETVDAALRRLDDTAIEFAYVLGNHECDRGTRLLRRWERRGVATHLDMGGSAVVPGVTLYGYDYRKGSAFSVPGMDVPTVPADEVSVLVLHQRLAPFRSNADADLDDIDARSGGGFDYVASGHLHDPERPPWDGGEFLYAGSTADLSSKPSPADPSVWGLTVDDGSITTRRRRL
jgi:predicted phosphodiesterase